METSFDPKTHTYLIDGKRATGVTTIIGVKAKPQLIAWAARMAVEYIKENATPSLIEGIKEWIINDILLEEAKTAHTKKKEAAGAHGTDAHAEVEKWIDACLVADNGKPIPASIHESIQKFADWANVNVDHFLFSEAKFFSKELMIAGTADFAYISKDGKKMMGDFKTSSGIYGIDYWMQVAAYRMLAEMNGDSSYEGSAVVRLGKDGSFEAQYRYDYETDKEAFLACLTLYRADATYTKVNKYKK